MKRATLLTIGLLLLTSVFISCSGGTSNKIKFLESIQSEDGTMRVFKYDKQNRIEEIHKLRDGQIIEMQKLNYEENELTKLHHYVGDTLDHFYAFEREGGTITVSYNSDMYDEYTVAVLKVNAENLLIEDNNEHGFDAYHYTDGNMTKVTGFNTDFDGERSDFVFEFEYDDKPSPFASGSTPDWVIQHFFGVFYIKNNIIKARSAQFGGQEISYEYEYNKDGFPIKQTFISENSTATTTYSYK